MFWPKLHNQKIKQRIFSALSRNISYSSGDILGLPGTYLDAEIFYDDAPFLKDAPFLSSLIANPNHIGCHTLGEEGESFFTGTQEIERDLLRICAEEIFKAEKSEYDGYVASGGTEANIEALWIYRNYFIESCSATSGQILVICSEDTHYSIAKAGDLLGLDVLTVPVGQANREMDMNFLEHHLNEAVQHGRKYFIPVLNMGTTMFGSVDNIDHICNLFNLLHLNYKLHVDAAYGGFIYPFTARDPAYSFLNPGVSSISLDAHKLLQAPYGTGIFLIRKGFMKYVKTPGASYVKGSDYTVCGSRSGANAICVWMILHAHGSVGWQVKMNTLVDRTSELCAALDDLSVPYYRHPQMNLITLSAEFIPASVALQFSLVPDSHDDPKWFKIVIMPHISKGTVDRFVNSLTVNLKRT